MINTSGFAFPKPGAIKGPPIDAFRVLRDGRQICRKTPEGRAQYRARTLEMWRRQKKKCCICGKTMTENEATFEHTTPRGMGGGSRDDRITDDQGKPKNGAAHGRCNSEKGSRRFKELYGQDAA
jgi:hypothetical protein